LHGADSLCAIRRLLGVVARRTQQFNELPPEQVHAVCHQDIAAIRLRHAVDPFTHLPLPGGNVHRAPRINETQSLP